VWPYFSKQFWKRNIDNSKLTNDWIEDYKPLEEINDDVYKEVENLISLQEWEEGLRDTKLRSVPGPTGISYPLIRKAGDLAQRIFLVLANKCIRKGEIPVK
jgi:hypothetical protein